MGNTCRFYVDLMALQKEVTGSCILNVIKFPDGTTKKLLIDCGLFQEKDYSDYNKNFPFNPEDIDYVVVTHNHVDHTGRLPLLVSRGFRNKIHTTYDTSQLIGHALHDSYKVLKHKAKIANERPLYSDEDVEKTLSLIEPHPFDEPIQLDEDIFITFFMNGHLPGAALVLVQINYSDDELYKHPTINLLFTGDYNNKNMFFNVPQIPEWVHNLPITIIQETTYGDMDSSQIEEVFEDNISNAVSQKHEIVIPVFSLGRSQEIMHFLMKMQNDGKLDPNIPIYFDGKLGIKYTELYKSGSLKCIDKNKDFLPKNFSYVSSPEMRLSLVNDYNQKIILTTSGMGSYGPAQFYLPAFLKRPNALIHFTGYVAENTLGRRLFDCSKGGIVEIGGLQVKKEADVRFTSEFSAHAKGDELIDFLKDFTNVRLLLLNHGETNTEDTYASRVLDEVKVKNVGILGRDYLFRVNEYGLIKSFSSKFL